MHLQSNAGSLVEQYEPGKRNGEPQKPLFLQAIHAEYAIKHVNQKMCHARQIELNLHAWLRDCDPPWQLYFLISPALFSQFLVPEGNPTLADSMYHLPFVWLRERRPNAFSNVVR